MELTWRRTLTGPEWKLMGKREDNTKTNHKSSTNINEFYLTHQDLKPLSNIFITMNKQTERGDFSRIRDVRLRSDKPFSGPYLNPPSNKYRNSSYTSNPVISSLNADYSTSNQTSTPKKRMNTDSNNELPSTVENTGIGTKSKKTREHH